MNGVTVTVNSCCATLLTNTNNLTKLDTVNQSQLNHHHSNPALRNPSLLNRNKLLSTTRSHLWLSFQPTTVTCSLPFFEVEHQVSEEFRQRINFNRGVRAYVTVETNNTRESVNGTQRIIKHFRSSAMVFEFTNSSEQIHVVGWDKVEDEIEFLRAACGGWAGWGCAGLGGCCVGWGCSGWPCPIWLSRSYSSTASLSNCLSLLSPYSS